MVLGVLLAYLNLVILFPKFLQPHQIGILRQIISGPAILLPLFLMGVNYVAIKYFPKVADDQLKFQRFFSFLITVPLILGGIISAVLFWGGDYFFEKLGYTKEASYYAWMVFPILFLIGYNNIFNYLHNNLLNVELTGFFANIWYRLIQLIVVALYAVDLIPFEYAVYTSILIYLVQLLVFVRVFVKATGLKFKFGLAYVKEDLFKESIVYSFFSALNSGGSLIIQNIDIVMTSSILGLDQTGIYSTAYFIALIVEFPKRAIAQAIVPLIAQDFKNDDLEAVSKKYFQTSITQGVLGIFLFAIIWINVDYLFELMPNGHDFIQGKWVILFIGLAKVYDLIWGANEEILNFSKYYKWNAVVMTILILLSFITNLYFIPKYGIIGTAIATFISIITFNSIRGIVLMFTLRMQPFRWNHLVLLTIALVCYYIASWFPDWNSIYLSIIIKSAVFTVPFLGLVYLFKVSKDFNLMIDKYLRFILRK